MSTSVWLTDEVADVPQYLRAKIGGRSDGFSLVQAKTVLTAAGTHIQATRVTASAGAVYGPTTLAWITDPLTGLALQTASGWTFHAYASVDAAADNAGLRFQVVRFTNQEAGAAYIDNSVGTALGTVIHDSAFTGSAPGSLTISSGDRLVFKVWFDNVGAMAAGTGTLSYNGAYSGAEGDSYFVAPDALTVLAALPANDLTVVRELLKDNQSVTDLSDAEVTQAIQDAIRVYSQDRPRIVADYYSGDGATFQLPLPRQWIHGFSETIEIEYPLNTSGQTNPFRQLLQAEDYRVIDYSSTSGIPVYYLWMMQYIPGTGTNNLVVRYTTRHRHDTLQDTIYPDELEAVLWLGASHAAVMQASKYARLGDSSIGADQVNYKDLTTRWRDVAGTFAQMYDDHIRGESPAPRSAGQFQNWHTDLTFGLDRLFHRRRWR